MSFKRFSTIKSLERHYKTLPVIFAQTTLSPLLTKRLTSVVCLRVAIEFVFLPYNQNNLKLLRKNLHLRRGVAVSSFFWSRVSETKITMLFNFFPKQFYFLPALQPDLAVPLLLGSRRFRHSQLLLEPLKILKIQILYRFLHTNNMCRFFCLGFDF